MPIGQEINQPTCDIASRQEKSHNECWSIVACRVQHFLSHKAVKDVGEHLKDFLAYDRTATCDRRRSSSGPTPDIRMKNLNEYGDPDRTQVVSPISGQEEWSKVDSEAKRALRFRLHQFWRHHLVLTHQTVRSNVPCAIAGNAESRPDTWVQARQSKAFSRRKKSDFCGMSRQVRRSDQVELLLIKPKSSTGSPHHLQPHHRVANNPSFNLKGPSMRDNPKSKTGESLACIDLLIALL